MSVRRRVGLVVAVAVVGGLLAVSGGFVGVAVATDTAPQCSTVSYTKNASGWNEVENVSQLQCIGANGLGEDYVLTGDIDASGTNKWNGGAGFDPIGNGSAFTGSFDGAGHTIATLTINRPSSSKPVGLFSKLDQAATVQKVVIDGANITGDGPVGGLVGQNKGMIHNVTVTGSITGTKPTQFTNVGALVGRHDAAGELVDVNASGSVTGHGNVGGLVGVTRGTLTRAHASVDVTAHGEIAGGAVGYAFQPSAISHSSASGTVSGGRNVGGLVGFTNSTVTASSASGDASATSPDGVAGGLVGFAGQDSVINASNASGAVSGNRSVGGLVGFTNSTVTASTASGDTTTSSSEAGGLVGFAGRSSMINRSSASGNVSARESSAGGLVGYLHGVVERSTASGDIEATNTDVGGLVGRATPASSITRSNATGTASGETKVGGLVGWNRGAVSASYATGSVTGVNKIGGLIGALGGTVDDTYAAPTAAIRGERRVGGLVGYIGDDGRVNRSFATGLVRATESKSGGIRFNSPGVVSDSYWNVETTNQSSSDGGTPLDTDQMTGSDALNTGNMDALSTSVWTANADTATERRYPTLQGNPQSPPASESLYAGGDGTAGNPYQIETWTQLNAVRENLDANFTLIAELNTSTADYETVANAPANGGKGFEPIGNGSTFTGSFDGAGYTIANLTIARPASSSVGLFSEVGQSATVSQLTLSNVNVTGDSKVGGVAGRNKGAIRNTTVSGTVTGTQQNDFTNVGALVGRHDAAGELVDVNASGSVTGHGRVGGIVGISRGTITRAHTTVDVTASGQYAGGVVGYAEQDSVINRSNATGTVSGENSVGGLVGYTSGMVAASTASGAVSGRVFVGGLVGYLEGTVERSTASGDIEATASRVGGLVGFATSESSITRSNASGTVSGTDNVGGLIGFAEQDSVINSSNASGVVNADDHVGGLVGFTTGTVTASTASGAVSGSEYVGGLVGSTGQFSIINRSNATGTVSGEKNVGGLVGADYGAVNTSYAVGGVTGGQYVGGLIGFVDGTVEDTYAAPTAAIRGDQRVGGLVGYIGDDGRVNRSFATGLVRATGSMSGGIRFDSPGSVSDSYWNVETTNQSSSDGGTPLDTDQMTGSDALNTGNMDALSTSVWTANTDTATERRYPTLQGNPQSPPASESLYAGGDGSTKAPYEIATWNHLDAVRQHLDANFTLVADLNESTAGYDTVANASANNRKGFDPIGEDTAEFTGTFNGGGHTISGLVINRSTENHVGLFGYVDDGAVERVTVKHANVTGNLYVGGIVGENRGTVTKSGATGSVNSSGQLVGGLVGYNRGGMVTESYATSFVGGTRLVGGLVGVNRNGTVTESYSTGSVDGGELVGGLTGANREGVVTGSYATGIVDGNDTVGGLTGENTGSVSDSYWDVETTNQSSSDGGVPLITVQMTGADALDSGNMDALSTSVWTANADTTSERRYPTLQENPQVPPPGEPLYAGGDGSVGSPYQIATWSQLNAIRQNPAANFTLTANLSASTPGYDSVANGSANGGKGFEPIGNKKAKFSGSFDGAGYTIANLIIDHQHSHAGLFGHIGDGSVSNVSLQNADITGGRVAGGLAGKNAGTITGSSVKGNITSTGTDTAGGLVGNNLGTVTGSMAIADVDGGMLVGGLVGTNGGTIIDSSAMGDTRGSNSNVGGLVGSNTGDINRSYATGSVSGAGHLGGLVGSNNDGATVTNTYAIGDIAGTEQSSYVGGLVGSNSGLVVESFATGEVDGDVVIGGLVGETDGSSVTGDNDGGTVTDSYWDQGTTNQSDAIGSGTGANLTGFGSVGVDEPAANMTGNDALADGNMDALNESVWQTHTDTDMNNETRTERVYPTLTTNPQTPPPSGLAANTQTPPPDEQQGDSPTEGEPDQGSVNTGSAPAVTVTTSDLDAGTLSTVDVTYNATGEVGSADDLEIQLYNDSDLTSPIATRTVESLEGRTSLTVQSSAIGGGTFTGRVTLVNATAGVELANESVRIIAYENVSTSVTAGSLDDGTITVAYDVGSLDPANATIRVSPITIGSKFTTQTANPAQKQGTVTITVPEEATSRFNVKTEIEDTPRSRQVQSSLGYGCVGSQKDPCPTVNQSGTTVVNAATGNAVGAEVNATVDHNRGAVDWYLHPTGSPEQKDISVVDGVDASTELNVTLSVTDFDPVFMLGTGNADGWDKTKVDKDTKEISITVTPAEAYVEPDIRNPDPNEWPLNDHTASKRYGAIVDMMAVSMEGQVNAGYRKRLDGAFIGTDAQAFSVPQSSAGGENAAGSLSITVAAPHYETDGKTINEGFYNARIPKPVLTAWGIAPGQVTATYKGSSVSDSDLTVESKKGAILVSMPTTYSSGTVTVSGSQDSSDTTAPTLSNVVLGSDGAGNLTVSFDSNEQLGAATTDLSVSVDGPTTTDVYTFDRGEFVESGAGPYTYTLTTTQAYDDGDGKYTATVDTATDSTGNNGGGSELTDSHSHLEGDSSATESDPESGSGESESNDGGGSGGASGSDDGGDASGESGSNDGGNSDNGGDSTDGDDSSDTSSSSGGGGGGSGGSGSATFLLAETAHTQTLEHSTLNEVAVDFAEPVDGLVRVTVVEAPDRPTIESAATVVGAVSITLPRESTETNATLAFTLNQTALETSEIDPADIVVYRIDTAGTVHGPVGVSVTAETDDTVTVSAKTPGFSTFVLATTQSEAETEPEAVQTESAAETTDGSLAEEPHGDPESTTEDSPATTETGNVATPGFGPLVALVALVMLALAMAVRSRNQS